MLNRLLAFGLAGMSVAALCVARQSAQPSEVKTPSGLTIIEQGQDELVAEAGDSVTVHYTGRLENGTEFDSSLPRNEPFTFQLGAGKVIKGWEEGVAGMKCGQKRQLVIPPELGYGAAGAPPTIPGNSTLIFDVQVLYIAKDLRGRPKATGSP